MKGISNHTSRTLLGVAMLLALACSACDKQGSSAAADEASVPPMKWKMKATGAVEGSWAGMDAQARGFEGYTKFYFSAVEAEMPPIFMVEVPGVGIGQEGTFEVSDATISFGHSMCELTKEKGHAIRFTIEENTKSRLRGSFEGNLLCDSREQISITNSLENKAMGKERPDEAVMEPTKISGEFALGSAKR